MSPISDKYRSRLQLTYRTNITGTPIAQRLPFRVLVLGEFLGKDARDQGLLPDLRERKISSIEVGSLGTKVDDFIKDMKPWMRIPESVRAKLATKVQGSVTFFSTATPKTYSLRIPAATATQEGVSVAISGTASFTSTKAQNGVIDISTSGLTVTGKITLVPGDKPGKVQPKGEDVELTISGTVATPLLDLRKSTPTPSGQLMLLASSKITVKAADITIVDNTADPEGTTLLLKIENSFPSALERTLPFTSLDSFSPDGVATNIPELHRLRVIRELVQGLGASLRNNPELRKVMRDSLRDKPEDFKKLQAWAKENYPALTIHPAAQPEKKE
ncbi:type VI secretion system contractile sheath small subunit [Polyangium aurulentum]|uniref:type VI secretion system contractile sheath small subunit n=1 Tax=Polyangium aurulentum TaxID=2567896 RepID=UPI0010AE579D|nr:type VI secretion system contractile sheath small subunit [Polyangium aurulentum]UQA56299.1 type VI secretion system contractile sheath small subunit [Polyangium aurulentum]